MAQLEALNRSGITLVLVTHDPEVARHARRIIAFRDGTVVGDTPSAPAGDRPRRGGSA
jgi:putative ABC transport system ATP-binding protein